MYSIVLIAISFANVFLFPDSPDAFVKEYKTHVLFSPNKLTTTTQVVIQINNKNGNWLSNIRIPYDKGNSIKQLKAKILDASGSVVRTLKNKEIVDRNVITGGNSYGDGMVKEFDLIYDKYPYFISYSYTTEDNQFIFLKWYANYKNQNTLRSELSLEFPLEEDVRHFDNHIKHPPIENLVGGNKKYTWLVENTLRVEKETNSPNWTELSPSVTILPINFQYGLAGSSSNWSSYGNWVYALGEDCNDFSINEENAIKDYIKGVDSKKEIVKLLFNKLQDETRYVNVSMGIGGMKPYPASYVSANKFGDCKALTYYMKSTLELFGIQSYPVDIYWSNTPRLINSKIPTQQFNHVFLCVPIEDDTLWLENTSNSLPFNYLDVNKRGQLGLLIKKDSSHLIELPLAKFEDVSTVRLIDIELKRDNKMTGQLTAILKGDLFETLKYISLNWSHTEQDSWMKRNIPLNSVYVSDWAINPQDRNDKYIELKARVDFFNHYKKYGSNLIVFFPKTELLDLENPDSRKYDLRIQNPIHKLDTIKFNLDQLTLKEIKLPENQHIKESFGSYQIEFTKFQNQVHIIKSLKVHPNTFSPGEGYSQLYAFIESIKSIEKSSYIQIIQ